MSTPEYYVPHAIRSEQWPRKKGSGTGTYVDVHNFLVAVLVHLIPRQHMQEQRIWTATAV